MILVADSGSSNTDWILSLSDSHRLEFSTKGINPFFLSEKEITKLLYHTTEIQPYTERVKEIYFFGAGCSSPDKHELVSNGLSHFFKNAFISVENDMLGLAYATCGHRKGLINILGTGSNTSFFDGREIQPSKHGLGYILGDEASGTYFGKKLITSYLYNKMPPDLTKDFSITYKINKEIIIQNIYQQPGPNIYLASFSKFMNKHREHSFIINLLNEGFGEFIKTHILVHPKYREDYSCHFVGFIAYNFQDLLTEICSKNSIRIGKILNHPIEELFKFILERDSTHAQIPDIQG